MEIFDSAFSIPKRIRIYHSFWNRKCGGKEFGPTTMVRLLKTAPDKGLVSLAVVIEMV